MRLALALLVVLGTLGGAKADNAVCTGQSLVPEIEHGQPEIWKAALADFEAVPNNTGLFWKIEKDGIPPSWLLGTMHVPTPGVADFRPAIKQAFDTSKKLVLESTEVFEENQLDLMAQILPFARYPENGSFDATFSEDEKHALANLTAAVGMPYFMARHFKPWFLAMSLSIPPCMQLAMLRGKLGVDARLRQNALASKKPVVGLETLAEQVEAMKSLDRANIGPDQLLEIATLGPKRIEDLMATDIDLYVQERPALAIFLQSRLPSLKAATKAFRSVSGPLIHDRNLRMRDRLTPLLEEGSAFAAIGAMHLIEKDGVIELLRADGYRVTRIE